MSRQSDAMDRATQNYLTPNRVIGALAKTGAMGGDPASSHAIAQGRSGPVGRIVESYYEAKSAMQPLSVAGYADVQTQVDTAFLAVVRPQTVLGRIAPRTAPPNTRFITGGGARASFVAENMPLPVTTQAVSEATMKPVAVGAILALTRELSRSMSDQADDLVTTDLAAAVAEAVDVASLTPYLGGTPGVPDSLFYNVDPIPLSGGGVAAFDAAFLALAERMQDATRMFIVMAPRTFAALSLMRGNGGGLAYPTLSNETPTLIGGRVLTSTACRHSGSPGGGFIGALDADEIVTTEGATDISTSEAAALQLDSQPGAGPQSLVAMFQQNMVGVRAVRHTAWARRRPGAAAFISGAGF